MRRSVVDNAGFAVILLLVLVLGAGSASASPWSYKDPVEDYLAANKRKKERLEERKRAAERKTELSPQKAEPAPRIVAPKLTEEDRKEPTEEPEMVFRAPAPKEKAPAIVAAPATKEKAPVLYKAPVPKKRSPPAPRYEAPRTQQVSARDDSQGYRIGVGDLMQVEVYDEEDLNKEVRVLTDGYISFPLIGSVLAEGQTVKQLEQGITRLLAAKFLVNPQVTVIVTEFSNVFVFGEVMAPGSFPIYGKMTVFEAVILAGGFTEVANPSKVKVIREERGRETSFEVDVDKITKKGDVSEDIQLRANDRVIVPRGFF